MFLDPLTGHVELETSDIEELSRVYFEETHPTGEWQGTWGYRTEWEREIYREDAVALFERWSAVVQARLSMPENLVTDVMDPLCLCGHKMSVHYVFSDHEECDECLGDNNPCSWFVAPGDEDETMWRESRSEGFDAGLTHHNKPDGTGDQESSYS